jgi:F1F0 ATPase subunit 2
MSGPMAPLIAQAGGALAVGSVFGFAYFAALRRTVDRYATAGGWTIAAALTLTRIVVAAGFFAVAAGFGAISLLAALLGFLIARDLAVRAAKGAV